MVRIDLFGGLRLWIDDHPEPITRFGTNKAASVLAYLAYHLDRPIAREILSDILWPELEVEDQRTRLRSELNRLRTLMKLDASLMDEIMPHDRTHISLSSRWVATDVASFVAELSAAHSLMDMGERYEKLRMTCEDIYTGDFVPDIYEDWAGQARDHLSLRLQHALHDCAKGLVHLSDYEKARKCWEQVLVINPDDEVAHTRIIEALLHEDAPASALGKYARWERRLRHEEIATTESMLLLRKRIETASRPASSRRVVDTAPRLIIRSSGTVTQGGPVLPQNPYYVARQADAEFRAALSQDAVRIVSIKGPRSVGKSSLLLRGLEDARECGAAVVNLDLEEMSNAEMESTDALMTSLVWRLYDRLNKDVPIRKALWMGEQYLEECIKLALREQESGLILAIDNVDRIFEHDYREHFCGVLRGYHIKGLLPSDIWRRLTIVLTHSTEPHLFITDLHQSPFNVGTRIRLNDFTQQETEQVYDMCGLPLEKISATLTRVRSLVGGVPFMVAVSLSYMANNDCDFDDLKKVCCSEIGLFGDHLRRMKARLLRDPDLVESVRSVFRGRPKELAPDHFFRLASAGLIDQDSQSAPKFRCFLYQWYLEHHLR
jgi:DNA-binding SARP family transcriptional activator